MMRTFEQQLMRERVMMGRPVQHRDGWEFTYRGQDGRERTFRALVYSVEPHEIAGIAMAEERWVVWDSSDNAAGGIVQAEREKP